MEQKQTKTDNMELAKRTAEQLGMVVPKTLADKVMNSLIAQEEDNRLRFPANYNVGNAVKSAYLKITGDSKLASCDQKSIAQSLVQMAILGLNPTKTQCYFVAYGKQCTLMPSYFGKVTATKRIPNVKDVRADVIYKGTEYTLGVDAFGNDDITITKPCPLDMRLDNEIIGAWAKVFFKDDSYYCSLLTMQDIQNMWSMGSANGKSKAHTNFKAEMIKKSAIHRVTKMYINTCNDFDDYIDTYSEVMENEYKEHDERLDEQEIVIETQSTPEEKETKKPRKPRKSKQVVEEVKEEVKQEDKEESTIIEAEFEEIEVDELNLDF